MRYILLVEDDAAVRETTKHILELKYRVVEASNYAEAMDKIQNRLDLAIIDYILPDRNGFELIEHIRKIKPSLPIIMITGYGTEAVVVNAFRAGIIDYIKKPMNIPYLMQKISEIFGEDVPGKSEDAGRAHNRDEFLIEGVAKYIENNYMKDITHEKVIEMSAMNKDKFGKLFKKRYGQSFLSYLHSVRLKNATELLKNPDLNVAEIAFFVGFGSVSQFERKFKEEFGVSPIEYRRKSKEE